MKEIKGGIVFYTKARRFGTIEVVFKNEKAAKNQSKLMKMSAKWIMFSMYMGRRTARVRISVIPPETKPG